MLEKPFAVFHIVQAQDFSVVLNIYNLRLSHHKQFKNIYWVDSRVKVCLIFKAKLLMGNSPIFVRATTNNNTILADH